jgi:ABC-type Fe3+-hydroxamate transport system substrate-binding protein
VLPFKTFFREGECLFLLRFARVVSLSAVFIAASCAREQANKPAPQVDDFGDEVVVGKTPARIVSLNPATTDLIFALGAGSRLVGRTHWDVYPPEAINVPDLGSGLRPSVEAVLGAKPDLVVLYASNDNRASAAELRAAGVNTISLKIDHIADFYRASRLLGRLLGDSARGAIVADSVKKTLDHVRQMTNGLTRPTVFWHIWDAPLITIGRGSYMNELIDIAGGNNVYGDRAEPSPQVSIEDVFRRNPEFIITGPEGANDLSTDQKWIPLKAVREKRVLVVDTAIVGRPSVRLGEAALSIARLLHPAELR